MGNRIAGVIDWALDRAISASRMFLVNDLAGRRTGPQPLIPAAQDFTAGWVALGPELAVEGYTRVTLWGEYDINSGANMRVRCLGRHTSGGNLYQLPILVPDTTAAYFIRAEGEYVEINQDADINLALSWDLKNTFPFILFQIQAGTVGAPACAVTAANVTYGWGS